MSVQTPVPNLETPHAQPPVAHASAFRKWLPLPIMGLAILIVVLDTTLLNVSLSTIVAELRTDLRSIQWVITAYSLTLASLTITGGRLGDLLGRKRMFVTGAVIFAGGSFLASVSTSVPMLILGESIIEGIGAALMLPSTLSLLIGQYSGRERALAMGIWGGMAGAGAAIGPVVGGYLTTNFSWRWGFRINVFVAALLVVASLAIKDRAPRRSTRLDWIGAMLSALGLLCGLFAIIEGSEYGWWEPVRTLAVAGIPVHPEGLSVVPLAFLLSATLLTLLALWERRFAARGGMPLLPRGIFGVEQFRNGVLLTGMMALGQIGLLFSLPVYLQGVLGLDAQHTGFALLPISAGLFFTAPFGGYISRRIPPKRIVQAGLVCAASGLLLLRSVLGVDTPVGDLIPPLAIYGIGLGLCFSQLANITLSAVGPAMTGAAAGVNNTVRQVGMSLGVAILGAIVLASLAGGMRAEIDRSASLSPGEKQAAIEGIDGMLAEVAPDAGPDRTEPAAGAEAEVRRIYRLSTVNAEKTAFLFTIGVILISLALSTRLPGGFDLEAQAGSTSGPRELEAPAATRV